MKPFMLRRLKTDVLDDLPPKILQDYYCDLSSIQCMLYEDFANKTKAQAHCDDDNNDDGTQNQNGNVATGHVFKVDFAFFCCTKDLFCFSIGFAIFTKIMQSSSSYSLAWTSKMVDCTKWIERFANQLERYSTIRKITCSQVNFLFSRSYAVKWRLSIIFRELLIECGIGASKDAVVSTHRALVFCQMKVMIDVIINQVLS